MLLRRALDQAAAVLDRVHADSLQRPTPCADWDVAALADHLVATPGRLLITMRGEQPDWSAPTPHVTEEWGPAFRGPADDLIHAWHEATEHGGADPSPAAWQCAEVAAHTWDLATALGLPIDRLDPEPAELGLEFMRANLRDEQRGGAFGPEQAAPDGSGPYERLAAFAGRRVC